MIIATGVTSNGVEYAIDDSYMAQHDSEEERRIIDEQRRIAHDILAEWARHTGKGQESA